MAEPTETPEAELEEVDVPASEAAVALALGRSGRGNETVDADASLFLREQARMVGVQREHLHEQRTLKVKHLEWRLFGDRVKGALQALSLVAGAAIMIGVGAMVWAAHENHGLVIGAFSVPPDLAQKGLTGQVVATLVLDRLAALDAKAQSVRAASSYQGDWGGDIKVEIPTTGVSLGDLERYLRKTLGSGTNITGNLFHAPAGLTLAVRAQQQPAMVTTGPDAELDALIDRAAEGIYGATQPYRYSKYLEGQNRLAESLAVARRLAVTGPISERGWARAQVSHLLKLQGDLTGAVQAARQALELSPDLAIGAINGARAEESLGHDEAALAYMRLALRLLARSGADISPEAREILPAATAASAADLIGDYQAARAEYARIEQSPNFQGLVELTIGERAYERAKVHDLAGSRMMRARAPSPDVDVVDARAFAATNDAIIPQYYEAADLEDWPAALDDLDRAVAATLSLGPLGEIERRRFLEPRRAFVLARMGRQAQAEALIAMTPLDCYLCVRMRGRIAAARGDWARAQAWFARAARQAPTLPFAHADWGAMLLARGDLDGAMARFAHAHDKSPRFADPLELWGEALMRRGDLDGAVAKFREAGQYAPRWGRLHLMWGVALARRGKAADAARQFALARTLDLAPGDRQTLLSAR